MFMLAWPLVGFLTSSIGLLLVTNTLQSGRLIKDAQYDEVFSSSARNRMTIDTLKSSLSSKRDFTQLFLRCPALSTTQSECAGPYDGHLLDLGVCAPLSKFISNRLFGPGDWAGKKFEENSGTNLFLGAASNTPVEAKRFACRIENSVLDNQPVLSLNYAPYNKIFDPVAWGMRDERRKVNSNLLIGCGGLAVSGGVRNFAPFALVPAKRKEK